MSILAGANLFFFFVLHSLWNTMSSLLIYFLQEENLSFPIIELTKKKICGLCHKLKKSSDFSSGSVYIYWWEIVQKWTLLTNAEWRRKFKTNTGNCFMSQSSFWGLTSVNTVLLHSPLFCFSKPPALEITHGTQTSFPSWNIFHIHRCSTCTL
jgi:hypothetical protein